MLRTDSLLGSFRRLDVRRQLLFSFGVVVALVLALGGGSAVLFSLLFARTNELASSWLPSVEELADIRATALRFRSAEYAHVLSVNPARMTELEQEFDDLDGRMATRRRAYEAVITSAEERKLYEEFVAAWESYRRSHDELIVLSRALRTADAEAFLQGSSQTLFARADAVLQDDIALNRAGGDAEARRAEALQRIGWAALGFGILATVLVASFVASRVGGRIGARLRLAASVAGRVSVGELDIEIPRDDAASADETEQLLAAMAAMVRAQREMAAMAEAIADGDLTQQPRPRGPNDVLGHAFRRMVEGLERVVAELRAGTGELFGLSDHIGGAARVLASGAGEQAAMVAQSREGLLELGSALRRSSEFGSRIETIARRGADDATKSGAAVRDTVSAMGEIAERTAVLEQLARQTHVLAVNASLEAVRAGAGGKAFSIVSAEVRRLSQDSGRAAKEIRAIVERSVGVAARSGELLGALVPAIQETATLVEQSAGAGREQAVSVEQVTMAINESARVSERGATAADELAAAAAQLVERARALESSAARFRLRAAQG